MGNYFAVIVLIFSLLLQGCTGSQSGKAITEPDGTLITPQRLGEINGTVWHLKKMMKDNTSIPLVENSETTFSCFADGTVSGLAAINRYSGNLKLNNDGGIVWNKAFIMTRMAGPPELMQQETEFVQVLMKTTQMVSKGSSLLMRNTDGSILLEFEQK